MAPRNLCAVCRYYASGSSDVVSARCYIEIATALTAEFPRGAPKADATDVIWRHRLRGIFAEFMCSNCVNSKVPRAITKETRKKPLCKKRQGLRIGENGKSIRVKIAAIPEWLGKTGAKAAGMITGTAEERKFAKGIAEETQNLFTLRLFRGNNVPIQTVPSFYPL
ncbi:hypothetical protein BGZ61DRAFT_485463 [Ilyonectria robusta]|uniref:uncharacterized protein n=1 Tax=Ilyonectria robusta TaxID=1079257 RepID=UPI001E8E5F20|nr:uncharacterized protein BGZ61DRAFT_485463 [Ilyonectria robusta]KAH8661342.1 hypothetical protein BGZ61DRAFT_485463 [Ilyonectria robusta]